MAFFSEQLNAAAAALCGTTKFPHPFDTVVPYTANPASDPSFGYGSKPPFAGAAGLSMTKGYDSYYFTVGVPGVVWNQSELRWTNMTGSPKTITHILMDASAGMFQWIVAELDEPVTVPEGGTFTRFATAIQIKVE